MLRNWMTLGLGVLVLAGCRNPSSCGVRVPAPSTGSYGPPNTYYQGAPPRTSALPAGVPAATGTAPGDWRSVQDTGKSAVLPASFSSPTPQAASPTTATKKIPRLNGMRVNEATPAAGTEGTEARRATEVSSPLSAASWQSRTEPPVDRVAGR